MKKVLFAAAVAAAGGLMAIESANIVGYQTTTPTAGRKSMIGVPFMNVTGGDLDIQAIVCKDGNADPASGYFRLWWWDQTLGYQYASLKDDVYADDGEDDGDGTEYTDKLYWCDDDDWLLVPLGWKHDESATATIVDHGKTFALAEGFFVQPSSSVTTPSVTIAGQVAQPASNVEYISLDLASGRKTMVVNPFCGSFDIQAVKCFDGTSNPASGYFRLWWWDQTLGYQYATLKDDVYADDGEDDGDGTEYTDKLYWCDDDDWLLVPLGWKHDESATATIVDHGKTFAAGEGFFVQPSSSVGNAKIAFANPFYVAP